MHHIFLNLEIQGLDNSYEVEQLRWLLNQHICTCNIKSTVGSSMAILDRLVGWYWWDRI
jgi:hypothetical protein